MIIINDDRFDETVNQPFPVFLDPHIHVAVFVEGA